MKPPSRCATPAATRVYLEVPGARTMVALAVPAKCFSSNNIRGVACLCVGLTGDGYEAHASRSHGARCRRGADSHNADGKRGREPRGKLFSRRDSFQ